MATTNVVQLPPRTIATPSRPMAPPPAPAHHADEDLDDRAVTASRKKSANAKRSQGAPKEKTPDPSKLNPTMPATSPTLADFGFMSPGPASIHVYNDANSRPLFGILRVPEDGGFQRQVIVHGTRHGIERWHLVDSADAKDAIGKAVHGGKVPLYGLDRLLARPDAPVLYMFDEYGADVAQEMLPDHVVVSGANETCLDPLSARAVTIWPDAGEAGTNAAIEAAEAIKKVRYSTGESRGQTLGIDLPDNLPDGWNPAVSDPEQFGIDIASLARNPVPTEQAFRPFVIMPHGYKMSKTGLVFKGDDDVTHQVTKTPFRVVAESDLAENGAAGVILRWQNRGQTVEFVALRGQISARGSSLTKELRENKMLFPESMARLLLDFLGTVEARKFIRTVNTVGWDQGSGWERPLFVMPGGDVVGSGHSEIRFAAPNVNAAKERLKYTPSGTLDEWQEYVAARAAGNSRLVLGICLALTSPLLKVLGSVIEAGGVHIWGGNGLGKSTYSHVLTSVWGDPRKLMTELDGTKTGFENAAELASCIGLFLEELKNDDKGINKEIGRIIYMWANRKGGLRSGPNIALRETKEFDIMFCSTGEYHLKTVIETSGGTYTGGIEARMTSIKAEPDGSGYGLLDTIHDAHTSKAFVDRMKDDCECYHGTAGRHFVARLIEDLTQTGRESIRQWFAESIELFIDDYVPAGADKMIHRVAKRFAVMATVGELALEYGTLPWAKGEAFRGVGACFQSWLDDRGGLGAREDILAVQQVRRFIEQHRFSRFEDVDAARTAIGTDGKEGADCYLSHVRDAVGFRELTRDSDGTEAYSYYVQAEQWKNAVCKGIDSTRAAKAVRDAGALKTGAGRNLTMQKLIPGVGKVRVYVITPAIMRAGDADDDDQE